MSLLSSPLHTIRISLLPSSTFLLLSLSRDYSGRWNNFASRRISLSLPLSLFLFYLIPPRFILSLRERGEGRGSVLFLPYTTSRVEPCGRVRSSARLSHRVSFSLGGEGGVDLTGLRSRVLLEGKSVLRHFQLRPSPPSVPIHSCTGTGDGCETARARQTPPPTLSPSLSLSLSPPPAFFNPSTLTWLLLVNSLSLPSPPLLDAGSPRRNWKAKFRGEERSFSGRFCFFFSRSRGVKWGSRRERTGLRSFLSTFWHVEAYYGEVWMGASVDGFSSACAFSGEKEGTGDSFEGIWIRRLGRVMLIARPRVERKRWCRFLIEALPIKTACAEVLFLK